MGEATIVGRDVELDVLGRVLDEGRATPSSLLISGDAGIGKTTLMGVARQTAAASGRRVLAARGSAAEVRLAHAGLADLLGAVDPALIASLPAPQRRALDAALLRQDPGAQPAPEPRALATGLVTVLGALAAQAPLVLLLDDLHWLDASSAEALRFAVRRLTGPVAIVAATRPGGSPVPALVAGEAERLVRLDLDALAAEDIRSLVHARAAAPVAAAVVERAVAIAAGNPFVAVEIARALPSRNGDLLPAGLRDLVAARLATLAEPARVAVLHAAMLTRPTVARVVAALGDDAVAGLTAAEDEGLLTLDGGAIAFAHPLLAHGASVAAPASARRAAHRRLAAVSDGEERARHLALGAVAAEPEVVAALETAAASARGRGATAEAAELLDLALRLGADDLGLQVGAAEHHLDAGDLPRARSLFAAVVDAAPAGALRVRALGGLGAAHRLAEDLPGAIPLLERAVAESDDPAARIPLANGLAFALTQCGRVGDARGLIAAALADGELLGDDGLLAEALIVHAMVGFLLGAGLDEASVARALALEDLDRPCPVMLRPSYVGGLLLFWAGRLEDAQTAIDTARSACLERGEEGDYVTSSMHAALLACARGDVAGGERTTADALVRARRLASTASLTIALENEIVMAGWTGDVARSRAAAAEGLARAAESGSHVSEFFMRAALGRLELSIGDAAAAAVQLIPAARAALSAGAGDPDTLTSVPDAIEALAALGRLHDADELRAWLRERSDAVERSTALAIAARCDAILQAARGELDAAEATLAVALAEHAIRPLPFEEARTRLVLGRVLRRLRRRSAARTELTAAAEAFARLGARCWHDRARAELARLDATWAGALTPAEARIARLAAAGRTNRETAALAFVSPKTVEATLTRVYRKLDIRSRAELGRWMAEHDDEGNGQRQVTGLL